MSFSYVLTFKEISLILQILQNQTPEEWSTSNFQEIEFIKNKLSVQSKDWKKHQELILNPPETKYLDPGI